DVCSSDLVAHHVVGRAGGDGGGAVGARGAQMRAVPQPRPVPGRRRVLQDDGEGALPGGVAGLDLVVRPDVGGVVGQRGGAVAAAPGVAGAGHEHRVHGGVHTDDDGPVDVPA